MSMAYGPATESLAITTTFTASDAIPGPTGSNIDAAQADVAPIDLQGVLGGGSPHGLLRVGMVLVGVVAAAATVHLLRLCPMYGISQVLTVVSEASSLMMAGTGISAVFAYSWFRRRRDQRRQRPVGQTDAIE